MASKSERASEGGTVMMRKRAAVAAALALLAAAPAGADDAWDSGLPGPLDRVARGVFVAPVRYRHEERLNSGFNNAVEDHDHRDLFKLGFGDDARPIDEVRVRVQLRETWSRRSVDVTDQSLLASGSRVDLFGQDALDVFEAFGEIGPFQQVPLSVRVGRQVLSYGEQRLVGPLEFVQNARTWDAVKLIFAGDGIGVDAWWGRLVQFEGVDDHNFNTPLNTQDFFGLYGSITLVPDLLIEPYYLVKYNDHDRIVSAETGEAAHHILLHAPGARFLWDAPLGFKLGAESVIETGEKGSDDIFAWGVASKAVWRAPEGIRPLYELEADYIFGSGDSNPKDGKIGTLDNLYPTNHIFYGEMDFVSWQNIHDVQLTTRWELFRLKLRDPPPKAEKDAPNPYIRERARSTLYPPAIPIIFETGWHWFWLASPKDAWYNAALKAVRRDPTGDSGRELGEELDLVLRAGPISVTYGHFLPGEFIRRTTPAGGRAGSADYFAFEVALAF